MRQLLVLLLSLLLAPWAGAAIYRWVDDAGTVHFGDCAPPDCPSEEVELGPGNVVPGFKVEPEPAGEPMPAPSEPSAPVARQRALPACYDAPEDFLGPDFADPFRLQRPRQLTSEEQSDLERLLRGLEGWWNGRTEDRTCRGEVQAPEVLVDRYRADLEVQRGTDAVWRFTWDLDDEASPQRIRGLFWFFQNDGRLGWGDRRFVDPAGEQWEPEVLGVDPEGVRFVRIYRQRSGGGGVLRRLDYFRLRRVDRRLEIDELTYTQGYLSGSRHWSLER